MKRIKSKSHLSNKERIVLLEKENTELRNQLSAMELRFEEAYLRYKIFQGLFIKEFAGKRKDALIFYYTFLALRNIKTKDLKKESKVKKVMFDISIKYKIYKETDLRAKVYGGEWGYTNKMEELYKTYYEHWRKKLQKIRKEYFILRDKYSTDIPLYDLLKPIP